MSHAKQATFDPFDLPLYPGVEQIQADETGYSYVWVTSYQVQAPREALFEWYMHELTEKGWTFDEEYPEGITWYYLGEKREPAYSLGVKIVPISNGQTSVRLRLLEEGVR